jgi:hypothetical protein
MIRRPTLYFAASFVALCLSAPAAGTDPEEGFPMISTIAVTSTRDNPTLFGPALEIYLMDADGTKRTAPDRENTTGEAFAALSGYRVVSVRDCSIARSRLTQSIKRRVAFSSASDSGSFWRSIAPSFRSTRAASRSTSVCPLAVTDPYFFKWRGFPDCVQPRGPVSTGYRLS